MNKVIRYGSSGAAPNRTMETGKSPNALLAEKRGLFVKEDITEDVLCQQGFCYSRDFFQWLCTKGYMKPKEYHHSGFVKNGKGVRIAAYYDLAGVAYIAEHLDMDFLHRIYMGELTYDSALRERGICFCRVRAVSELVGVAGKDPITADCIRQGSSIWFSKEKYIRKNNDKIKILAEWDTQPNDFKNPNTRKIIRMLFSRGSTFWTPR